MSLCSLFLCTRLAVKQTRFPCSAVRYFTAGNKLVDITYNDDTEVSTVTLRRGPVNAFNQELLEQFNDVLDSLEKNKSAGMILTSSLPTVFCAGLDIVKLYQPDKDQFKYYWTFLQDTWLKLCGSSFPIVAAINGHSPAGGCMLALACEYRIMVGPEYKIGLNEALLGIVAPKWLRDGMTSVIGKRQSELALITGQMFKTAEALRIGLIDEIASDKADAIKKAEIFLKTMSASPPEARSLTKKALREEALTWLVQNREKDFNDFYDVLSMPITQQNIKIYLDRLHSKKSQKSR